MVNTDWPRRGIDGAGIGLRDGSSTCFLDGPGDASVTYVLHIGGEYGGWPTSRLALMGVTLMLGWLLLLLPPPLLLLPQASQMTERETKKRRDRIFRIVESLGR